MTDADAVKALGARDVIAKLYDPMLLGGQRRQSSRGRRLTSQRRDRVAEAAHHLEGTAAIFGQPDLGVPAVGLEEAINAHADDAVVNPLAEDVLTALDWLA